MKRIVASYFVQKNLKPVKRKELIAKLFSTVISQVDKEVDIEFINNDWFIDLISLVIQYKC